MKYLENMLFLMFCILAVGIPISNAITSIGIVGSIVVGIVLQCVKKDGSFFKKYQTMLIVLGIFIGFNLLSLSGTAYMHESIRGVIKVLKWGGLFLVALMFFESKQRRKKYLGFFLIVSGIIYLDALWQHFFSVDIFRQHALNPVENARRLCASFHDPNNFGGYIIVLLLLAMSILLFGNMRKKWAYWGTILLIGLGFFCLYRTISKGAWVGFLVGAILLCFYKGKKALILLAVCVVLGGLLLPQPIKEKIKEIVTFQKGGTSWERMQSWQASFAMIKDHPFRGLGVNTYSKHFPQYRPREYKDNRYAHNCYLQMAAEIGIAGLVSFFCLVGYIFWRSRRRILMLSDPFVRAGMIGLWCGCIGFLVHSGMDTHLYSLCMAALFWVSLGMMGTETT